MIMKMHFVFVALAASLSLATFSSAQAHSKRHVHHARSWCATHYCAPMHVRQPAHRHYPVLDGSEPLCGFNDGTYLRNRLECGFP
jgi:hypothetical protein